MPDPLEQLEHAGRDKLARAEEERATGALLAPARGHRRAQLRSRRAMRAPYASSISSAILFFAFAGAVFTLVADEGSASAWAVAVPITLGAVALAVGVSYVWNRREIRWLKALPIGLDFTSYEALLGRTDTQGKIWLSVHFDPGHEHYRGREHDKRLELALRAGDVAAVSILGPRNFLVESPKFETRAYRRHGGGEATDLHPLHRWFRRYAKKVLVPLHSSCAIREVVAVGPDRDRAALTPSS